MDSSQLTRQVLKLLVENPEAASALLTLDEATNGGQKEIDYPELKAAFGMAPDEYTLPLPGLLRNLGMYVDRQEGSRATYYNVTPEGHEVACGSRRLQAVIAGGYEALNKVLSGL